MAGNKNIGELTIKIGADTDGLDSAVPRVAAAMGRVGAVAAATAALAVAAIAGIGIALVKISMNAGEAAKELTEMAGSVGVSASEYAKLQATADHLGISQSKLNEIIKEGKDGLALLREAAEAAGSSMSDIEIEQVRQAGEALNQITGIITEITNNIAVELAPIIQAVAEYIGDMTDESDGFKTAIRDAVTTAVLLFGGLERVIYNIRTIVRGVVDVFVDMHDVVARIFNAVNEAAGLSARMEVMGDSVRNARTELEKPPSSEEWLAWLETIRLESEKNAKETIATRNAILAADPEIDKEAERMRQRMAARLQTLRESLMTEAEVENQNYAERLVAIQDFLAKKMITQQEAQDLEFRATSEHLRKVYEAEEQMQRLRLTLISQTTGRIASMLDAFGSLLQADGEKNFKIVKALSIASAVLKGYEAIVSAYAAGAKIGGPPLGAAYAAIAAATTAAQIAKIASTTATGGGGGGGSAGVAASATPTEAAVGGRSQTLYVEGINPSQLYSGEAVRALAANLIEFQRDGGQVVLARP